ncbi:MAG: helix-turn-helix domain-containing protein [Velocimicrobium sp.]
MEVCTERKQKRINTYVIQCEKCVSKCYSDPNFSYQMLAEEVGITPYYLGTIFKLEKGESIREYVNTIRLEHACELLEETNHTIKFIAEEVGFISCNHFFMSFKRKYGMTPKNYRML